MSNFPRVAMFIFAFYVLFKLDENFDVKSRLDVLKYSVVFQEI